MLLTYRTGATVNGSSATDTDFLLEQARNGNLEATQTLLEQYRDRLRAMVRIRMDERISMRLDPSDVVQEALLIAHERLPAYLESPVIDFYPWLRRIAWNRLIDLHRRHLTSQRRTVLREVSPEFDLSGESRSRLASQLISSGISPLQQVARAELLERVHAALATISAADREVLTLRFLEQLSADHAAQVLGISKGAFKARQLRAIARVRSCLDLGSEDHHP